MRTFTQKITISLMLLSLFLTLTTLAKPHQDHRIGIHGMVLFSFADKLYISHLPLAHSKHDQQLIVPIKNTEQLSRFKQLVAKHALITVAPKPFDLALLMQGKLPEITADIYQGHFERGGKRILTNQLVELAQPELIKSIVIKASANFYQVAKDQNTVLVAHQISEQKSFDQLLVLTCQQPEFDSISLQSRPYQSAQLSTQINSEHQCLLNKILYTETQDFQ